MDILSNQKVAAGHGPVVCLCEEHHLSAPKEGIRDLRVVKRLVTVHLSQQERTSERPLRRSPKPEDDYIREVIHIYGRHDRSNSQGLYIWQMEWRVDRPSRGIWYALPRLFGRPCSGCHREFPQGERMKRTKKER